MQPLKTHIDVSRTRACNLASTVFPAHKWKLFLLLVSMELVGCPQGNFWPLWVASPHVITASSDWTPSLSLTTTWQHVPLAFIAYSTHWIILEPFRKHSCNPNRVRIIVCLQWFFYKRICQGIYVCLLRTLFEIRFDWPTFNHPCYQEKTVTIKNNFPATMFSAHETMVPRNALPLFEWQWTLYIKELSEKCSP